ncbi:MAG: hypothetical protein KDB35_19770, partial [Acidimicrobiales bacterium]|nr:hypothetical protein [Acidimicrobiales bacterium]
LLIWHIDETMFTNSVDSRRLVDVEEAGEQVNPDWGAADDSDPWPGSTGATRFDTLSSPDSRRNDGRPSGVSVSEVDDGCAPTMAATVDPGDPSVDPPVPPNDALAGAATLVGEDTATGYNVGATVEAGEPHHHGEPGGASVWWEWTSPIDGLANLAIETTFPGVVAVYRGDRVDALSLVTSGESNETVAASSGLPVERGREDSLTSPPSFPVRAGVTYRLAVDGRVVGAGPATGGIRLSMTADAIGVEVVTTPDRPVAGSQVSVEVTVRNLDEFSGLDLYEVFDGGGTPCTGALAHLDAGEQTRCTLTATAPDDLALPLADIVYVSGQWDYDRPLFQWVSWDRALVGASPPVPPSAAPRDELVVGTLARTGADVQRSVAVGLALVLVGAALVVLARCLPSRPRCSSPAR